MTSGTPSAMRAAKFRPEQQAQNRGLRALAEVGVAAGLAERLAGDEQPRTLEQALLRPRP